MIENIPKLSQNLSEDQIKLLKNISTSCRHSIISMLKNSQSGHPGGSLGCIDYLTTLYSYILSQTKEVAIISNGHISPAVYSILAELEIISKKDVIKGFRKIGFPYEGHVTRHVNGVWYGTGPLGTGISAAAGFALAEKLQKKDTNVYALIGDGESQEGQVYEMMNFAAKYKLDNFIVFMDYNQVQLTDSVENIMPVNFKGHFEAAGWEVIEVNGHDYTDIWKAIGEAHKIKNKPILLLGHTIMGKGVDFMEKTGQNYQADWHGKAPKPKEADQALAQLVISEEDKKSINEFIKTFVKKDLSTPKFVATLSPVEINSGSKKVYSADELTDCRSAYGNALLDLAKENKNIVALTADLSGSVKTNGVKKELPHQHIECGVAEQHMVSCAGGMSLHDIIPFASTFGAFMTSRAKDQARVNDINQTNVKMVATHCGLSVGEDGPTHQAIDDMGSMLGLFNTMVMEPADPNQCDRIIRYAANHYGNMYIRMGRHKIPVLTHEDGSIFFDENYTYEYGKCDKLREGSDITIAATGPTVIEALQAYKTLKEKKINAEIIIVSSLKKFDNTLLESIKKTKKVLTVEDHNTYSGYGSQIAKNLEVHNIQVEKFAMLGVEEYQLSGTAKDLYQAAGIDSSAIIKKVESLLS